MKKAMSWVLALALVFAASPLVFAEMNGGAVTAPVVAHTITQTAKDGGAPTSAVGKTVNIGDTFDILFQKSAFVWNSTGTGAHSFDKFKNEWVKIGSSDTAFELVGAFPNTETGQLTVRLKAAKVYSGSLSVYLNSAESATTAWSAQITVEDPKQKAAEEEAKRQAEQSRLEEQQRQAEQSRLEEQQRQAEQSRLEEQQRQAEQSRLEEQQRQAEQSRLEEQQRQAEQSRLEEQQRQAEQSRLEEQQRQAEQSRLEEQQRQAEQSRLEEEKRQAEQSRLEEEKRQTEQSRLEEEKRQAEQSRLEEEKRQAEQSRIPRTPANDTVPQQSPPAPTIFTVEGVKQGGSAPTTTASTLSVGDTFLVSFDRDTLDWSASGQGEHRFSAFKTEWIKISTTAATLPVERVGGIQPSENDDGTYTLQLRATAAYTGDLTVYLEDGNSNSTKPLNQPITISAVSFTATSTVSGGGNPKSTLQGNALLIDDEFTVEFDKTALNWTGQGKYAFPVALRTWLKITSSTGNTDSFIVKDVLKDEGTGAIKVQIKAIAAYSGDLSVFFDSNEGTPTKVFTQQLTVTKSENLYTMNSTVRDGGNPTTTLAGSTLATGSKFDVVFDKTALNWSGQGKYDFTGFNHKTWVKVVSSTTVMPVVVEQVINNQETGTVTVRLRADTAFDGTLTVYLDSDGRTPTKQFSRQITITQLNSRITKTVSGGTAPTASVASGSSIDVGQKLSFTFPANNFQWDGQGTQLGSSLTDVSWIKLSGAKLTTDFIAEIESTTDSSVRISLTPIKSGTYRNLSVSLQGGGGTATTSSSAMEITVRAVNSGKITGIRSDARLGGTYSGAILNRKTISYNELGNLEVNGGDELLIPIYAGFFTWSGDTPHPASAVTKTQLNNAKIRVTTTGRSGSKAFTKTAADLYFDSGTAYIKLEFAKDHTNTRDIDFEMTILLTIDGKRHNESALLVGGTLVKEIVELHDSYSYIDLSDGLVVQPTSYLRGVELYLGEGVTVIANLSSGRKYSGTATTETTSTDEALMRKYPEIDLVYTLKTSGLGTGSKVTLDLGDDYYVYNEKLDYIGRSDEELPYSNKYYLSVRRSYFDDDDDFEEIDDDEPDVPRTSVPSTTIDTTATANKNSNPRTGR